MPKKGRYTTAPHTSSADEWTAKPSTGRRLRSDPLKDLTSRDEVEQSEDPPRKKQRRGSRTSQQPTNDELVILQSLGFMSISDTAFALQSF